MLAQIDLSRKIDKTEYKTVMEELSRRLAALQREAIQLKIPIVVVFEGWDAAGKGTLINQLMDREQLETGAVSGTGEGRHTTVRRELIRLDGGALVIDNPGMREFGILGAEDGMSSRYADIAALSARCRYRDCRHTGEPGCAVLAAMQVGEISPAHLGNFHKLREESNFNDLSYAEKRKKDRDFGRYIKSVKKDLRNG